MLRRVGLGESGRGDWDALGASSLLFAMDPHYLEAKGFLQIGGGPFTPDLGLRPHVARYAKALKRDYDAAFKRGVSKGEHRILSLLASQFPESEREWDGDASEHARRRPKQPRRPEFGCLESSP